jgi:hypothetical protein
MLPIPTIRLSNKRAKELHLKYTDRNSILMYRNEGNTFYLTELCSPSIDAIYKLNISNKFLF